VGSSPVATLITTLDRNPAQPKSGSTEIRGVPAGRHRNGDGGDGSGGRNWGSCKREHHKEEGEANEVSRCSLFDS
jgi:hypothetical protein